MEIKDFDSHLSNDENFKLMQRILSKIQTIANDCIWLPCGSSKDTVGDILMLCCDNENRQKELLKKFEENSLFVSACIYSSPC